MSMLGMNSTLAPFIPPAKSELRIVVLRSGARVEVEIHTHKLQRSASYLYSAYLAADKYRREPILQWVSNPGNEDLVEAISRHLHKEKKK